MSATRTFRVSVQEWTLWKTYVEADSLAAAEAEAQRLWDDEGPDAFTLDDSGTDGINVEEIAS